MNEVINIKIKIIVTFKERFSFIMILILLNLLNNFVYIINFNNHMYVKILKNYKNVQTIKL